MKTLGAGLGGTILATGNAAAAGPTAVIESDQFPFEDGEEVVLDGSGSTGDIASYEWYWKNNNVNPDYASTPESTEPQYEEMWGGYPYSVKLIVKDQSGNTDSAEVTFAPLPEANPIPQIRRATVEDAVEHTFIARGSTALRGEIESYEWYWRNTNYRDDFPSTPWATGPAWAQDWAADEVEIKLVVTDTDGRTAEETLTLTP